LRRREILWIEKRFLKIIFLKKWRPHGSLITTTIYCGVYSQIIKILGDFCQFLIHTTIYCGILIKINNNVMALNGNYTTRTAALKATKADVKKISTKKLLLNNKDILDYIK
jgi:hypothetical protein